MNKQGFRARMIRFFGFFKREILGLFRQPRLIVTLIVAPFLILGVFGLGYRTQPPPFETILVLPSEDAEIAQSDDFLNDAFGGRIELVDTTTDAAEARTRLRTGEVDLLIIAPADAISSLEEGEKAQIVVVHSQVDPVIRTSIVLVARLSVEELNRLVLSEIVAEAQSESETVEAPLTLLKSQSDALVEAMERGDSAGEQAARDSINNEIDALERDSGSSDALLSSISDTLGTERASVFDQLRGGVSETEGADGLENAKAFNEQITALDEQFGTLQGIDSELLVSPFTPRVEDIANLPGEPALFYAPGVMLVLIQHLAITFAALSLVRERQLGLTELFRASPLNPTEILLGKYAAFFLIGGVLATVLTGGTIAFGTPLEGSIGQLALIVALVILSSLGLGFLLSSFSKSDSQAVQYTMIVLLASIFFTGLILPLQQIIPAVRTVSFLIPSTYGISALHDIMFRGLAPSRLIVWGLAGYSLALLMISWLVMRRHVRNAS